MQKLSWTNYSRLSVVLVMFAAAIGVSCASTSKKYGRSNFKLPKYEEVKLNNGSRVLFIHDDKLPRVSLHALVMAGSIHDPAELGGVNSMVIRLLNQGTRTKSAPEIAEAFAQIGADFSASSSYDYSYVTASGISPHSTELLELFGEVLMEPTFAEAEVNRAKSQVTARLQQLADDPAGLASTAFESVLFGDHPYGELTAGNLNSVPKIRRADVIRHYFRYFRPNNTIFAVVGDFSDAYKTQVKTLLSGWTEAEIPGLEIAKAKGVEENRVQFVHKSGLEQAQIRIGQLGIERNHPDFLPLRAANVVLGGAFASRLNKKVRQELGLTYSIWSNFDTRLMPGSFSVSTFSRNDKANEALKESLQVLEEFIANGITKEELDAAKALLIGQFPSAIETGDRLAFNLLLLRYHNIGDNYLTDYMKNVDRLSLSQVNKSIKNQFKPNAWQIVIYADEAAVSAPEGVGAVSKSGFKEFL